MLYSSEVKLAANAECAFLEILNNLPHHLPDWHTTH